MEPDCHCMLLKQGKLAQGRLSHRRRRGGHACRRSCGCCRWLLVLGEEDLTGVLKPRFGCRAFTTTIQCCHILLVAVLLSLKVSPAVQYFRFCKTCAHPERPARTVELHRDHSLTKFLATCIQVPTVYGSHEDFSMYPAQRRRPILGRCVECGVEHPQGRT